MLDEAFGVQTMFRRKKLESVDGEVCPYCEFVNQTGATECAQCYYVMDKVLRADNDGIAVYVAPTKALVNQVRAEIYARFNSKQYPAFSKQVLCGDFLREYSHDPQGQAKSKWGRLRARSA